MFLGTMLMIPPVTALKRIFAATLILTSICSGANAEIRKAASASFSDVSAAVSAAGRGDTVMIPPGTVTWTSTLTLSRGINVIGAGRDLTTITRGAGAQAIAILPDTTAIAGEETIRVEGLTLDGDNSIGYQGLIYVQGGGTTSKPFKNLAVGNCRFQNVSGFVFLLRGQNRGAIFNNDFNRCNIMFQNLGSGYTDEWSNGKFPFSYGNADNLFFEGNTIRFSSPFAASTPGWLESGQSARVVCRYNTWDMTNASDGTHMTTLEIFDVHGFQNWFSGNYGQTGTMIVEFYGNTIAKASCNRTVAHRGSWGLYHNNVITGPGNNVIHALQYGVGDTGGSGCTEQVPGANGVYRAEINNTYVFNNTVNGTIKNMTPGGVYGCGIKENSHYWNFNPSFDGTSGIGRGTDAPNGDCIAGVAYWKASTPTPTIDPGVIQNGTLYKATANNVWTAYYTPYTYPHPLTVRPTAPKNLHFVSQ